MTREVQDLVEQMTAAELAQEVLDQRQQIASYEENIDSLQQLIDEQDQELEAFRNAE